MESKRKRCAYRPCPPRTDTNTSYFSFPKVPERAAMWLKACNREDLVNNTIEELHKNYQLCDKHFESKCYSIGSTRKRLFDNALPTMFWHTPAKKENNPNEAVIYSDPNRTSIKYTAVSNNLSIPGPIQRTTHFKVERDIVSSSSIHVSVSPSVGSKIYYIIECSEPNKTKSIKKIKSCKENKKKVFFNLKRVDNK